MIALMNVIIINNHSFIEKVFQTWHKTKIFTFLSCFFLPQKETEIHSPDKKVGAALSWYNSLRFRSPCLSRGDSGVSANAESQEKYSRDMPNGTLRFHFLKRVLDLFLQPVLLVIICIFQVCALGFFCFFVFLFFSV